MTPQFDIFYKLFNENQNKHMFYSWLSPNGDVYPIPSNQSHGDWADNFLKSKGLDTNKIKKYESILDIMFKKGWCRITKYGDTVYCHKTGIPPTERSLKNIIDACVENNIQFIKLDNETDIDKILWANEQY